MVYVRKSLGTKQVALGECEGNVHSVLNELMERANETVNTRCHFKSVFLVCTDTMRIYFSLQTNVTRKLKQETGQVEKQVYLTK